MHGHDQEARSWDLSTVVASYIVYIAICFCAGGVVMFALHCWQRPPTNTLLATLVVTKSPTWWVHSGGKTVIITQIDCPIPKATLVVKPGVVGVEVVSVVSCVSSGDQEPDFLFLQGEPYTTWLLCAEPTSHLVLFQIEEIEGEKRTWRQMDELTLLVRDLATYTLYDPATFAKYRSGEIDAVPEQQNQP